MKKVLIFVENDFEDSELIYPLYRFKEAGRNQGPPTGPFGNRGIVETLSAGRNRRRQVQPSERHPDLRLRPERRPNLLPRDGVRQGNNTKGDDHS